MASEISTVHIVTYDVKNVRNCHCYVSHIRRIICIMFMKLEKYLIYVGMYLHSNYYRHVSFVYETMSFLRVLQWSSFAVRT